jgi:chemotaxis-related protein WspB
MLFLLFQLGHERYALEAGEVAEVLPLVGIRPILQAPPGVAGILNYHGSPVPVMDLSQLTLGQPAARRLNTRIVLVQYRSDGGTTHLLGLIAERATEILRCEPSDFTAPGVHSAAAPYLGPVVVDARGVIQKIEVNQLVRQPMRDVLFREPSEH